MHLAKSLFLLALFGCEASSGAPDVVPLPDASEATPSPDAATSELIADAELQQDVEPSDTCLVSSPLAPAPTAFVPDDVLANPTDYDWTPDAGSCAPETWACEGGLSYRCEPDGKVLRPIEYCGALPCIDGECCQPDCQGKTCGSDGCGFYCGTCATEETCLDGSCVAGACAVASELSGRELPTQPFSKFSSATWGGEHVILGGSEPQASLGCTSDDGCMELFASIPYVAGFGASGLPWARALGDGQRAETVSQLLSTKSGLLATVTATEIGPCDLGCPLLDGSDLVLLSTEGEILWRVSVPGIEAPPPTWVEADAGGHVAQLVQVGDVALALSVRESRQDGELFLVSPPNPIVRLAEIREPQQVSASGDHETAVVVRAHNQPPRQLIADGMGLDGVVLWTVAKEMPPDSPLNVVAVAPFKQGVVGLLPVQLSGSSTAVPTRVVEFSPDGVTILGNAEMDSYWSQSVLPLADGSFGIATDTTLIRLSSDGVASVARSWPCGPPGLALARRLRADGHVESTDGRRVWVSPTSLLAPACAGR